MSAAVGELRFTVADLENFPDDGKRYEIIDGELYVTTAPRFEHQSALDCVTTSFRTWDPKFERGFAVSGAGLIFADDQAVIPDLLWTRADRLIAVFTDPLTGERDGHSHEAPDLAVEILSPGSSNAARDRRTKLRLYSRRGVQEYWIVNPYDRTVEVYRRSDSANLVIDTTLRSGDTLTSPLLPGFSLRVDELFRLPPGLAF